MKKVRSELYSVQYFIQKLGFAPPPHQPRFSASSLLTSFLTLGTAILSPLAFAQSASAQPVLTADNALGFSDGLMSLTEAITTSGTNSEIGSSITGTAGNPIPITNGGHSTDSVTISGLSGAGNILDTIADGETASLNYTTEVN